MNDDPSDREGLRTAMTSEPNRPTALRAGLGWLLILLAVAIGFGVGSRFGLADNTGDVANNAPGQTPDGARGQMSQAPALGRAVMEELERAEVGEDLAWAAPASLALVTLDSDAESPGEFKDDFFDAPSTNMFSATGDASGDYELGAIDTRLLERAMPIDALPLHEAIGATGSRDSLTIVTRGEIGQGESLGSSLHTQGISPGTVHLIATEMRKVFDFRHSRAGDRYRLGQDSEGRVLDFRYSQSPEESYYLAWEGKRYVVKKETTELKPQISKIAGIVDSSFYGAVLALGEQSVLASNFAQILAWDIDFSRSVHPGDEFQILYERLYRVSDDGEDEYVRTGRILAGRYSGRSGEHTVVYFEDDEGVGSYFRPDGSSIERAFLAAPLKFGRITSRFTWARHHPILKVTRPHPGIDYAAPRGTPIWSVAAGTIEYRARAGASGNLVRIRHQNGLTSHYAHMQSFAKGLKVGSRVEQKQVIGYVGTTGLSTGPHVCFRVKRDGKYVDPMKISGPAGEPVEPTRFAAFQDVRDQLLADLGSGPLSSADGAL
jgi:murein DD-endopeptidase MepM/ murein hydrolase activator NlpD